MKLKSNMPYMSQKKDGSLVYSPPHLRYFNKPLRPIPAPKPRVEKREKTLARLTKSIKKAREREDNPRVDRMVGTQQGEFVMTETDGHRALLQRGEGKPTEYKMLEKLPPNSVKLEDPELFLAVKRALIIADKDSKLVKLDLDRGLTVRAECEGDTFEQFFTVVHDRWRSVVLGVNGSYLLDCLGSWPLFLHWSDAEGVMVLRPEDDSWRYAVMLMRV